MNEYIIQSEIDKLTDSIVSTRVRLRHPSYLSLMRTEKGSKLKLIGSSTKFDMKIDGLPVKVAGLYLAPHTLAGMGINMCPMAGECVKSCLTYSGRLPLQHQYQVLKTRAFVGYPVEFLEQLIQEIKLKAFEAHLEGYTLFIRLNGTSDNRWERYLDFDKMVKDIDGLGGFYDYTKFPLSARRPSNSYHLTFSVDEQRGSEKRAKEYDEAGYPFAVVATKEDYKMLIKQEGITDGDESDFRFRDSGLVVLKAKNLFKSKEHEGRGRYTVPGKGLVRTAAQILKMLRVQA
jgi:hypothetical protein